MNLAGVPKTAEDEDVQLGNRRRHVIGVAHDVMERRERTQHERSRKARVLRPKQIGVDAVTNNCCQRRSKLDERALGDTVVHRTVLGPMEDLDQVAFVALSADLVTMRSATALTTSSLVVKYR